MNNNSTTNNKDDGSTTTKKRSVFGKIRRSLGMKSSSSQSKKSTTNNTTNTNSVSRSSNVSYSATASNFATGKHLSAPSTTTTTTTAANTTSRSSTTPKRQSTKQQQSKQQPKPSWLTRTKFFRGLLDQAFVTVDQDGSGTIDEKELYSGLLLIHLQLGVYGAGPAACKPISREKCHAVFIKMDIDNSGYLDRTEFDNVMCVLFGNVLLRVIIQYACTLLLVPILAQYIYQGIMWCISTTLAFVATLDDNWEFAISCQTWMYEQWTTFMIWFDETIPIPDSVVDGLQFIMTKIDDIPDKVWDTIPITLISAVLSLMLIPWSLMKIDDFFQYLAERNGTPTTTTTTTTSAATKKKTT